MPYIPKKDKEKYEPALSELRKLIASDMKKGELTYLVYALGLESINKKGKSYTNISSAISCLDDAKEELRRRHLNPYEDEKIKENGNVE
ncbi:MAG: hypothetical protein AABX88_01205 [Nanoarchaeota archaeon]